MGTHRMIPLVAIALVALAFVTTEAAADITGLTVSPNPAAAGAPVSITIVGTGACPQVSLDFGDRTPQAMLTNVTLPHSTQHRYMQPMTTQVTAQGVSGCQGQVSVTLTVAQAPQAEPPLQTAPAQKVPGLRLAQLCQLVNCSASSPPPPPPPDPAPPKIDQVQGTVTPGSELHLIGSGFGTAPGTVSLSGQFPGGVLKLLVLSWQDTWVSGSIPSVSGVPDHNATLQVAAAGCAVSNAWPVSFIATRDTFRLPSSYVQVVSCRDADERNICGPGAGFRYFFPEIAITGYHTGWIFGASGSDVYSVTLGNGWMLDRFWVSSSEEYFRGKVSGPSGFTPGSAAATLTMNWQYYPIDWVSYNVVITVKGPRGVPFR